MRRKTSDAVRILHKRFLEGDPDRKNQVQQERINAEVAALIYNLRMSAGLGQKDLAALVGTTQSVISRLEDSDYEGHSLSMLNRIARALNTRLTVSCVPRDPNSESLRHAFQLAVRKLRMLRGFSVEDLAKELDVAPEEILSLERDFSYRPPPLILYRLSKAFDVPQTSLNVLAGATTDAPPGLNEQASRFAAQSESFERLTREEKKILDEFVKFLRDEFRNERNRHSHTQRD